MIVNDLLYDYYFLLNKFYPKFILSIPKNYISSFASFNSFPIGDQSQSKFYLSRSISVNTCFMRFDRLSTVLTPEMPKRRDLVAVVLIVLPWTLLITVWHQSTIPPLLATQKGRVILLNRLCSISGCLEKLSRMLLNC